MSCLTHSVGSHFGEVKCRFLVSFALFMLAFIFGKLYIKTFTFVVNINCAVLNGNAIKLLFTLIFFSCIIASHLLKIFLLQFSARLSYLILEACFGILTVESCGKI